MKIAAVKIAAVDIREGEHYPKWYYGYAYAEFEREVFVFYPIPFNYLMRFLRYSRIKWDEFRGYVPETDKRIIRIRKKIYMKGFLAGMKWYEERLNISALMKDGR